jgi:hypothetical protein
MSGPQGSADPLDTNCRYGSRSAQLAQTARASIAAQGSGCTPLVAVFHFRSEWPRSAVAASDQGVHLPTVKVGVQKLSGQKRTEMKYCAQLWSDARLPAVVGKCGDAVLRKIPIRMYTTMKRPILLKRVLKKFTPADPSFW